MARGSVDFLAQLRYEAMQGVGLVDPFNRTVWQDELPDELPSSQHTFIFSGPPLASYALAHTDLLTPIGLIQDVQHNAQRQISPIAEMGNFYHRHVPGRWNHSAMINRILSKDANILGACYRWALKLDVSLILPVSALDFAPSSVDSFSLQAVSIDSELLNLPFGIYVVKLTENGDFISASFWERCLVAGYTEAIQSGQVTLMESMQVVMGRKIAARNALPPALFTGYELEEGNDLISDSGGAPVVQANSRPQNGLLDIAPVRPPSLPVSNDFFA